jgi:hypothetical protein
MLGFISRLRQIRRKEASSDARFPEDDLLDREINERDQSDPGWDDEARRIACYSALKRGLDAKILRRVYGDSAVEDAIAQAKVRDRAEAHTVEIVDEAHRNSPDLIPAETIKLETHPIVRFFDERDEFLLSLLDLSGGRYLHVTYSSARTRSQIRAYRVQGKAGDWWVVNNPATVWVSNDFAHAKLTAATMATFAKLGVPANRIISLGNEDIVRARKWIGLRIVRRQNLTNEPIEIIRLVENKAVFSLEQGVIQSMIKLIESILNIRELREVAEDLHLSLS